MISKDSLLSNFFFYFLIFNIKYKNIKYNRNNALFLEQRKEFYEKNVD